MCFTGLTADSDEEIDDAACHFVVKKKSGFSTGGEKIIQISSNTPLFLYLFEHGCCNYIWLTPCYPSLSYTLWFGRFLQGLKGKLMLLQMHVFFLFFLIAGIY